MNAQVQPVMQQIPAASKAYGIVLLQGRIQSVRKAEDRTYTVIALPAPDSYSMPGVIEVSSTARLGSAGEDVTVKCRISGMPNNFTTKDGERVKSARNFITATQD